MQHGRAHRCPRSRPRFFLLFIGVCLALLWLKQAMQYEASLRRRVSLSASPTKPQDHTQTQPRSLPIAAALGLHFGRSSSQVDRSPLARFINVNRTSLEECKLKISNAAGNTSNFTSNTTLVIYHLGLDNKNYSYRVQHDNIQIFLSVREDSLPMFTIVQVLGGRKENPFMHLFQNQSSSRVCFVDYFRAPYDLSAHVVTLASIGQRLLSHFKSVFLLNHSTRGPLSHRLNGKWLEEYNAMLANVVLAGAMFNCEIAPHVQTHAFIFRTDIVKLLIAHHLKLSYNQLLMRGVKYIMHAEIGVTPYLRDAGYDVTSRTLKLSQGLTRYVPEVCANTSYYPVIRSALQTELIFYKFGGTAADYSCSTPNISTAEVARLKEYLLPQVVTCLTDELHKNEPKVNLLLANSFCREDATGESEDLGSLAFRPNTTGRYSTRFE